MSLAGNLEDLGLDDIIHIVNLSRKSGILILRSRAHEGLVVFRHGQVVRARASCTATLLGEVLKERGIIDGATLEEALLIQKREGFRERLGPILIRRFKVAVGNVEIVAQEQIREIMLLLSSWHEGTFDFELRDDIENVDDVAIDPVQFVLEQGLSSRAPLRGVPQAQEDVSVAANRVPADEKNRLAVIVDDDSATLEHLSSFLKKHGWEAATFLKSEEALISIDAMYRRGSHPTVVLDLIMPRMDGSGILGGLELLELLHCNFSELPVLAMADYHNLEAERKVKSMGLTFMLKPRRTDIAEGKKDNLFFCTKLLQELERRYSADQPSLSLPEKVNIGAELLRELGVDQAAAIKHAVPSTGISLLRSMLGELNNPGPGGGIILLVLRFAAEFMNRAVIFSVRQDDFIGLGQFGIADNEINADSLVRNLRIPLDEPSLFRDVLHSPFSVKLHPEDNDWNRYLFSHLGGFPSEVFLGPIVSGGKAVAILYGDNLPGKNPLGDTDSLEIFLSQAGVAMEKLLLERRLRELNSEAF